MSTLPLFNPRDVPVIGTGAHLSAVPASRLTPQALRARFNAPPIWTPEVVQESSFSQRARSNASVLLPLVMRDELKVLLTERTLHLSTHGGQVAFPGGKADATDADAVATALRETQEEVGLTPNYVEVIGTLPHYITGTHFVVSPVVALVDPNFELKINPFEVARTFEVPLRFLMNPANHQEHMFEWQGAQRRWFSIPYKTPPSSDVSDTAGDHEHFIWGATAGMLRNFYRFLSA